MSTTKKKLYKKPEVKSGSVTVKPKDAYVSEQDRDAATVDRAINKLISVNQCLKNMNKRPEELFMSADLDMDGKMNTSEFIYAMKSIGVSLDQNEAKLLFDYFDVDKNKFVTLNEFVKQIKLETKKVEAQAPVQPSVPANMKQTPAPTPTMPTQPLPTSQAKPSSKETLQKIGVTEEEVRRKYDEFLAKVKIDKADMFSEWQTIFNDPIKALKKCSDLVKEILKKKADQQYWDDPEFGPTGNDPHGINSICYDVPFVGSPHPDDVFWYRPKDICPGFTPEFLVDGASSNDVMQGAIGDCWIIGAMSVLSTDDRYVVGNIKLLDKNLTDTVTDAEAAGMMMGVYPPIFQPYRKYGIYVMRFFKNFTWRYVIIDDKLPCQKTYDTPELLFASCNRRNEFWVPLIEKAYAKLHGAYQALISGDLSDGLVDFTGLVSEKLVVHNNGRFNTAALKNPEDFWKRMTDLRASRALMGCSITGTGTEHAVIMDGNDTGLLSGHAYSIQSVMTIKDNNGEQQRLIRIRNPWGNKNPQEWSGRWSDNSEEMISNLDIINAKLQEMDQEEAELVDLSKPENFRDGAFFMCYEDFLKTFSKMSICIKFPEEYQGVRYESQWKGKNAGGTPTRGYPEQYESWANNEQYMLTLTKKTHVFISLGQEDGRLKASATEVFPFTGNIHPVVIVVLKSDGKKTAFDSKAIAGMSPIKQFKEVSLNLNLEPGKYAIVPSTMDPGQEGKYYLSIYHNAPGAALKLESLSTKATPTIIPEEEETPQNVDEELKKFLKLKIFESVYR